MGSNTCPKCDISLDDHKECIACCVCELNFYIECTNTSQTVLLALKDTTQNFKRTCNVCKQNFPCMTGLAHQLKLIEEKTHDKISIIEQKIDIINQEIGARVKHEVDPLKTGLVNAVKEQIKSSLQDDVRKELNEIEDQQRWALNLIVFNLPESNSKNSSEKRHDNTH